MKFPFKGIDLKIKTVAVLNLRHHFVIEIRSRTTACCIHYLKTYLSLNKHRKHLTILFQVVVLDNILIRRYLIENKHLTRRKDPF